MATPSPPRDRQGFEIALICALKTECDAVLVCFDKIWEEEGRVYGKAPGDLCSYSTGLIGHHNVVLAYPPGMGKASASGVAASVRSSFNGIKLALIVGVCGSAPSRTEEIYLGDIIISKALIQYDFGRQYPKVFETKDTLEDGLGRPNQEIRSILTKLTTRYYHQKLRDSVTAYLRVIQEKMPEANCPDSETDQLYKPSCLHKHRKSVTDEVCGICDKGDDQICPAALKMDCDELGCEKEGRIVRSRPTDGGESSGGHRPTLHFGKMGSGDAVMKSGEDRDRIAREHGIIAFEMEGAGVWEHFPSIVIKGVCDYADSHKNKKWQDYAAATAAAGMKAFLKEWNPKVNLAEQDVQSKAIWHVPFSRMQGFFGRSKEIEMLEMKLFQPGGCSKVAMFGLGGVGKSRLALQIADNTRSQRPTYSIFWIQATDSTTFETDVFEIGKKLEIPGLEDEKNNVKNLVKQRLSQESTGKWLIILDNADDKAIWGKRTDQGVRETALADYLPRCSNGSILITTRTREVATYLAGKEVVEVAEMSQDEAVNTLSSLLIEPEIRNETDATLKLVEKLTYLPLAIVQAAAYVNMNDESIHTYLELLDDTEENVIDLLSEDFRDEGRYKDAQNSVASTWRISFEKIRLHCPQAAEYLSFMSCLNEKNIPQSLLPEASSKKIMNDAIGTLTGYSFLRKRNEDYRIGPSYDMHRLVRLATRTWLRNQNELLDWTEKAMVRIEEVFPRGEHKERDKWTFYTPHAQSLYASNVGGDLRVRYSLLEKMGICLRADGKYHEAVIMLRSVVKWREKKLGSQHQNTLCAYNNLGLALCYQGHLREAEKYHKSAYNGYKKILTQEHPHKKAAMIDLMSAYRKQGKRKMIKDFRMNIMRMRKRVLGAEHPDTLTSMSNLAVTYIEQGKWKMAEELQVDVMKTRKRVLGAEHPDTLTSMGNLAVTYSEQGKWKMAEELEVDVMKMGKRVLGAEHPDTLTSIANLACGYWDQERWKEAVKLMAESAQLSCKILGDDHPDTKDRVRLLKELEQDSEQKDSEQDGSEQDDSEQDDSEQQNLEQENLEQQEQ